MNIKDDDKESVKSATDIINELKSKTSVFFDVLKSSRADGGQPLNDSITNYIGSSTDLINEKASAFKKNREKHAPPAI